MPVHGSLGTFQANQPGSAGPPFPGNSADNGLSVDPLTGHIVLGQDIGAVGDPAQLLSGREIPMVGHPFTMRNAGFTQFRVDPGLQLYELGDIDSGGNGQFLGIDDANNEWFLGQRTAVTNLLIHIISAGIGLAYFDEFGTNPFLIPNQASGGATVLSASDFTSAIDLAPAAGGSKATIGDINGAGNNTLFGNDDPAGKALITHGDTTMIHTTTAYANGAGVAAGTLLNAPAAGNPTKWIPVDDNGVLRHIPAW